MNGQKNPQNNFKKNISCLRKDYSSEADKSILGIISEQPVCGFCYFISANTDCYFSCYVMLYYNKKPLVLSEIVGKKTPDLYKAQVK